MDNEIVKLKDIFDSIVCLTAEGPEFHTKLELMEAIEKEAMKGYELCRHHLSLEAIVEGGVAKQCGCNSA